MRRLARIVLVLQLAGAALLAITQVSASAQPSASPSASPAASSSAPPEPSPTASSSGATPGGAPSWAAPSPSSPAPTPSSADTQTPSPTTSPASRSLTIDTRSMELVAQVGDLVHYRAVVANEGDAAAERVFVVGFLPPEVTFLSAELLPEVEATLYQRVGNDEYVTWNVGEIAPGDSLTLSWTGRVTSSGDMTAVSAVRAVADGLPRQRRETSTYLATASNLGGPNPSPRPTTTRVVTYDRVPRSSTSGTSSQGGAGAVPETGFSAALAFAVAGLSVGLGLLLWWIASPRPGRRRRVALAVAAMALLAACTSGRDVERAAPEPTGSPEVKGRRIGPGGQTRDLGEDQNEASGEEAPGTDDDAEPEDGGPADEADPPIDPGPGEPDFTLVRNVDVIPVESFLGPEMRLRSHDGDGPVTYGWNGFGFQGIDPALTRDGSPVRVHTELRERGSALEAVVTVTNTSTDTPIIVEGRLGLAIQGSAAGRLTAAPTRVTLMPGGSTAAAFAFDLPPGVYASEGFFESG